MAIEIASGEGAAAAAAGDEGGAGGADRTGAIDQRYIDAANAAAAAHIKRLIPKALEEALRPFQEKLATLTPSEKKPAAAGEAPGGTPSATGTTPLVGKADEDPIRAEMEELKKSLADERAQRQAEARTAREAKAYSDLRSELVGKVRPEAVETAARLLFHADKRVRVPDEGPLVFQSGEQELPLGAGVRAWLKSDEAKIFLPAPGYGASGDGAGNKGKGLPPRGADGKPIKETAAQRTARLFEKAGASLTGGGS